MAVASCKLMTNRTFELNLGNNPQFEFTYQITTDTLETNADTVRSQAHSAGPDSLPELYQSLGSTTWGGTWCNRIKLAQTNPNNNCIWTANVTFGALPQGETPDDQGVANPLNRPVRYWSESMTELQPVIKDKDGNPIRNAADDEFLDPLMREVHIPILVAQKNLSDLAQIIQWNLDFDSTTNEKKFHDAEPGEVLFFPIQTGAQLSANGTAYYAAEFRFGFKPGGWKEEVVNQGLNFLVDTGEVDLEGQTIYRKERAVDEDGEPTPGPILLDVNGTKLPDGEVGNTVEVDWRERKDFVVFGV